jgi:hypothetical protein
MKEGVSIYIGDRLLMPPKSTILSSPDSMKERMLQLNLQEWGRCKSMSLFYEKRKSFRCGYEEEDLTPLMGGSARSDALI